MPRAIALWILLVLVLPVLAGCADRRETVTLPAFHAWFEGRDVVYVTTDVSDPDMARVIGANHVPRLRDALPPRPKPPAARTALERVYIFADGTQTRSVFASIPRPVGPASEDEAYSPIWQVYFVARARGASGSLRSEAAILDAEAAGDLTIQPTNIVVNCPVVSVEDDGALPGIH